MLLQSAVVDERIFCEDGEVLADVIIQTSLILGSHHVGLAVGLIHVVACLGIELLAYYRGNDECINALGLIAYLAVQIAVFRVGISVVGDAFGKCHTCGMNVF